MPKYIVTLKALADVEASARVEAENEEDAKSEALKEVDLKWDCTDVHPDSREVTSVEKSKLTIVTRRDQIFTDRVIKHTDEEPPSDES